MPLAATGGFDMVLAVSNSSFEALLETRLRAALPLPPGAGVITLPVDTNTTISFSEIRATAFFPPGGGTTFALRLSLLDASLQGLVAGSLGQEFAIGNIQVGILVTPSASSRQLSLQIDGANLTISMPSDADSVLLSAPVQSLIVSRLRSNFPGLLIAMGVTNPLLMGPPIPRVPRTPLAVVGTVPGLSELAIGALARPAGSAILGQALAFCLTFQDRPNTPAGRGAGSIAGLPAFSVAGGADATLQLDTVFLFELIISLGLAPSLGLPTTGFTVSRTTGLFLLFPLPVTLGGTTGTLVTLTVTPPVPLTALPPALGFGFTFVFVLDDITYTLVLAGATLTLALAGSTIVVSTMVPAPTVTAVVPWWKTLLAVLGGVLLGGLLGPYGALVGGITGGFFVAFEALIVSAIVGPTAAAAAGGFASPTLPPAFASIFGTMSLSPPLTFDDLTLPSRIGSAALAAVYRQVNATTLSSGGMVIDLDTGARQSFAAGGSPMALGDLLWYLGGTLHAGTGARLVSVAGDFNLISVSDVVTALSGSGPSAVIAPAQIPVIPAGAQAPTLPAPLVIAVRTSAGRYAKCALWLDVNGDVIMRYLVWDTRAAACRILPVGTAWARTNYVRDPDTPGATQYLLTKHERFENTAQFQAQATRVTTPIQVSWRLGSTTLTGATGTVLVGGAAIAYTSQSMNLTLVVALGSSLSAVPLTLEVRDANGIFVSETRALTVIGRIDQQIADPNNPDPNAPRMPDFNRNRVPREAVERFRQARLRERVDLSLSPSALTESPGLDKSTGVIGGIDDAFRQALIKGGYGGSPDDIWVK